MVMSDKFIENNSVCAFYMNKKSVDFLSPVMIEAENEESAREIMISSFMREIIKRLEKVNNFLGAKTHYYIFLRSYSSYIIQKRQDPIKKDGSGSFVVLSQRVFFLEDKNSNEFRVPRREIYDYINELMVSETVSKEIENEPENITF